MALSHGPGKGTGMVPRLRREQADPDAIATISVPCTSTRD
jgi:hypothetical protein